MIGLGHFTPRCLARAHLVATTDLPFWNHHNQLVTNTSPHDTTPPPLTGDFNFELCFTASSRYGTGGVIGWHMEERNVVSETERLSKEHISGLQKHLETAYGTGQSVVKEFNYLKNREIRMHQTSESTNRRILIFSCSSIVGLLGFSAVQLWWLRRWFKSKKLL